MPVKSRRPSLKRANSDIRHKSRGKELTRVALRRARKMKKVSVYHKRRQAEKRARR